MERLTQKQSAGYDLKALNGEYCNHYCEKQRIDTCKECALWEAIQKLAYYEDLEEQGKLIKHGHWHSVHHYQDKASGICSVCHKQSRLRVSRDDWGIWYIDSPYCPACGSIMDEKINYT